MFCNFKNLINKFKKVIIFKKMLIRKFTLFQFKLYIRCHATVFIWLTFFFIFCPFLVKDASAFSFQSDFDFEQSSILSREHFIENLSIFRTVGEFSSFEYLNKCEWPGR